MNALNIEISKALALAIGWSANYVALDEGVCYVRRWPKARINGMQWNRFDFRDPAVIWPIAVKYNMFPELDLVGFWSADGWKTEHPTPEMSVAVAVIEQLKGK